MQKESLLKITITADLHLTTRQESPERYLALENILEQMIKDRIDTLVIAGDLFHETSRNYAEFENFCKGSKYKHIQFHVIPGNHDAGIENALFAAENLTVYSEPEVHPFDLMSVPFLFLPYKKGKTMGEIVASFSSELDHDRWVLIGHGDWIEGMREVNPLEPGIYMPLTRTDLEAFKPVRVLLGHIHKPMDRGIVHHPGSPCPLDINETGRRRFLIVDTENGFLRSQSVDSPRLYFNESFVILPVEDESDYLRAQIESRIGKWRLTDVERSRARIRIKVHGYTSDRRALMETLKVCFKGFTYYKDGEPDIDEVSVANDPERAEIAQRVMKGIQDLEWPEREEEPGKEKILLEALHVIYGD